MSALTVGFIGVGRLGLPLAQGLLDAGFAVVTTKRGRSDELVAAGGIIAGDGTPRDVAEAADVIVTCMPSAAAFEEVIDGPDGILRAEKTPPVIESSTLPLAVKRDVRMKLVDRQAQLIDAPVSGTPPMVQMKIAMIYASGDRDAFLQHEEVLRAMCPKVTYVGTEFSGSKFKFVAQFLATIHVTATVEAMVYAAQAGLDLQQVAELISTSPGATSGQFQIRAPMIAAGNFEAKLVTVDMTLKDVDEVIAYAREIGAPTDLSTVVADRFHRLSEAGLGNAEPAALFRALMDGEQ
jgi:3-hydroxyisobutyrate dehydrogenase-like beta-hydroxyacid dehydrogenase